MGHEIASIDHRRPERRLDLQLFYGRCSGEAGNTREVFIYICLALAGGVVAMGHEVGSIDYRHPKRRVALQLFYRRQGRCSYIFAWRSREML